MTWHLVKHRDNFTVMNHDDDAFVPSSVRRNMRRFPNKNILRISHRSYACYMPYPSHPP